MKKIFQILKLKSWSKNLLFLAIGLLIAGGITVSAALTWTAEWTNVQNGQTLTAAMLQEIKNKVDSVWSDIDSVRSSSDCGVNQVVVGVNTNGTMQCANASTFSDITCNWVGWKYESSYNPYCYGFSGLRFYCTSGRVTATEMYTDPGYACS